MEKLSLIITVYIRVMLSPIKGVKEEYSKILNSNRNRYQLLLCKNLHAIRCVKTEFLWCDVIHMGNIDTYEIWQLTNIRWATQRIGKCHAHIQSSNNYRHHHLLWELLALPHKPWQELHPWVPIFHQPGNLYVHKDCDEDGYSLQNKLTHILQPVQFPLDSHSPWCLDYFRFVCLLEGNRSIREGHLAMLHNVWPLLNASTL